MSNFCAVHLPTPPTPHPPLPNRHRFLHVLRRLCGKLSWKHQSEVVNRLRRVEGAEAGEEAFEELLEFVKGKNLAAAESLGSRKDGILSFHRLNVPATLNVTFLSTNHIENVMRNSGGMIGKVCRWNSKTDQLERWMGVALLRVGSSALSLRTSSAPPARPSAGKQSELLREIGFS
jgi:hypothetical protein